MEPQEIVAHLKQISLFQRLTGERGEYELYHVARIVREATYERGEWLFGQGEISDRLYLILEGRVRLTRIDRDGVTHYIGTRGPGDVLGKTGLLVGDFHDVTAEALEPVRLLFILRDEFEQLCQERSYLCRRLHLSTDVARRRGLPKFEWLRDDEWVIFAERRHWSQLIRVIGPPLLLAVLIFAGITALVRSPSPLSSVLALLLAIPLIGLTVLIGWHYLNWRDDFFVLTTQRIVHIERVWPFRQSFEESPLENIEDIYELRPSLTSNLLNFGNLVLQTAGETVQIDMDRVPCPDELRELIFREIERTRAVDVLRQRGAIREVLGRHLDVAEDVAEPPEEGQSQPAEPTRRPSALLLLIRGTLEYFFPSSWSVSEDGRTIVWRRYWLPGALRYTRVAVPLIIFTFGGSALLMRWWGQQWAWMALAGWLLVEAILFGWLLWFVEDWRNDYFQLTPNRIVLVSRKPLLLQGSRREASLENIQNISFEIPSAIANIFHYGHVVLETAGTMGKFELKWVKDPERVQAEISKRQREYMERERALEARRRQDELLAWFSTYDEMRGGRRMHRAAQRTGRSLQ